MTQKSKRFCFTVQFWVIDSVPKQNFLSDNESSDVDWCETTEERVTVIEEILHIARLLCKYTTTVANANTNRQPSNGSEEETNRQSVARLEMYLCTFYNRINEEDTWAAQRTTASNRFQ